MGSYDNAKYTIVGLVVGLVVGLSVGFMASEATMPEPPQIDQEVVYEEIMGMDAHSVVELYLPGLYDQFVEQSESQSSRIMVRLWLELEEEVADYLRRRALER